MCWIFHCIKTPFIGTIGYWPFPRSIWESRKCWNQFWSARSSVHLITLLAVQCTNTCRNTIFLFPVHRESGSNVCKQFRTDYNVCLCFSGILLPSESAERPNQTYVRPGSSEITAALIRPKLQDAFLLVLHQWFAVAVTKVQQLNLVLRMYTFPCLALFLDPTKSYFVLLIHHAFFLVLFSSKSQST